MASVAIGKEIDYSMYEEMGRMEGLVEKMTDVGDLPAYLMVTAISPFI